MRFHHIGYLTHNLDKTTNYFKKLEYKKFQGLIIDKNFKVKIQFLKNGNNTLELIKPNTNNYGLIKILNQKNYAYHFAYKVKNLNRTILKLKKNFKIIINPTPAIAFRGKKVAFLTLPDGFIIELIQS